MLVQDLTSKQRECVTFEPSGPLIIKGVPGSGKTVVIAGRAIRLTRQYEPASALSSVRVFTYNTVLAEYVRSLVASQTSVMPDIVTFHSWARGALTAIGKMPGRTIEDKEQQGLIKRALVAANVPTRLLDQPLGFWHDEFAWMKGRSLWSQSSYAEAKRSSRGTAVRVTAQDRVPIFAAFEHYNHALIQRHACDWDDYAALILRYAARLPPVYRADHALIDEAQDLKPAQIAAIAATARLSLTIAADKAQNIYRTGFRWSDIGIDVRGRVKTLTRSFRCNRVIAELALSLKRYDPTIGQGEGEAEELIEYETERGDTPVVTVLASDANLDDYLSHEVGAIRWASPKDVIAVLCPTKKLAEAAVQALGYDARLLREHKDFITPGVVVSTIHSAKGLEFDHVFVTGLKDGVLPRKPRRDESEADVEGELSLQRHLLYVAMTRARRSLHLITGPGACRFVSELDRALYVRRTR